jgi:hypothetical protein
MVPRTGEQTAITRKQPAAARQINWEADLIRFDALGRDSRGEILVGGGGLSQNMYKTTQFVPSAHRHNANTLAPEFALAGDGVVRSRRIVSRPRSKDRHSLEMAPEPSIAVLPWGLKKNNSVEVGRGGGDRNRIPTKQVLHG